MREARRSQWPLPLASRATKQTARKALSLRVAAKCSVCIVALLGFVVLATTFVARLAFIRILPATQSAKGLIRGSLVIQFPIHPYHCPVQLNFTHHLRNERNQALAFTLHSQYVVGPGGQQLFYNAQPFILQIYYF